MQFHDRFRTKARPQVEDAGFRVVRASPSEHDVVSYVLMHAFDSPVQREEEDRFYGGALWREGYREEVLAMIATYKEVVLPGYGGDRRARTLRARDTLE
ncbi:MULTISPECIES: hypothetical protein [unclassified Microbacterium]|uniref:hypothetical protein n=1 Tax=unclassified Microbacterium TaxID=2609290 RepID=UPI003652C216